MTEVFRTVQQRDELPKDFIQVYTSILYKYEGVPEKDPANLKGYRPLSLMNADYKIYTSILMRRLIAAINPIIGDHQSAFLTGRQIGDNVKLMQGLIDQYGGSHTDGLQLMFLDQEKAYDRVSHSYLWAMMEAMSIPNIMIRQMQALYRGRTTRIYINGFPTNEVQVLSGLGQGDPLSCPLYVIAIEGLALLLQHSSLSGIQIGTERITCSMFADDTAIPTLNSTAHGDMRELDTSLETYNAASGSKINWDKTVSMILDQGDPHPSLVERECKIVREGDSHIHLGIPIGVKIEKDVETH